MNVSAVLFNVCNKIRPMELPAPITFIVMAKKLAKVAFVLPVRFPIRELGNPAPREAALAQEQVPTFAMSQTIPSAVTANQKQTALLAPTVISAMGMKLVLVAHAWPAHHSSPVTAFPAHKIPVMQKQALSHTQQTTPFAMTAMSVLMMFVIKHSDAHTLPLIQA